MGIVTAILSVLGAIASVFVQFFTWAAKTIPWYVWLVLIVGCIIFGYGYKAGSGGAGIGCSCRDFMCRRSPRPPRPPRTYQEHGIVVSVEAANRFILSQGKRRERVVTLAYVVVKDVPVEDSVYGPMVNDADLLPFYLTRKLLPVGQPVTVTVEGRRILGDEPADTGQRRLEPEEVESQEAVETPDSQAEGRGPITGIVVGPTGADVGLALVAAGLATITTDAPATYKAAAKTAKKRK